MDISELREEVETDFTNPGAEKSGEYLHELIRRRLRRILPTDREVVLHLIGDWINSDTEPYASLGINLPEKLGLEELRPNLVRLLARVERGEALWPSYASRIRAVISRLGGEAGTVALCPMEIASSRFRFDESDLPADAVIVAELPTGISSKRAPLEEVADRLHFPDYFGVNWDALEECIRDLSWLPAGAIVLKHRDLPLREDVASLKTYLSVLSDAVHEWSDSGERRFVVLFPREARKDIARACS